MFFVASCFVFDHFIFFSVVAVDVDVAFCNAGPDFFVTIVLFVVAAHRFSDNEGDNIRFLKMKSKERSAITIII